MRHPVARRWGLGGAGGAWLRARANRAGIGFPRPGAAPRRLLAPLFLLPLTLAGCQMDARPGGVDYPADVEAGEVPIRFEGPGEAALLVPVFINGQGPFDFVLDTGATLTCLDQRLVDRLELPTRRHGTAVGAGVEATGRLELVRLDSVRIGGAGASDLSGCVLDLAHTRAIGVDIDGLVGLNFLRSFRVTLDFERDLLVLEQPW